MPGTFCYEKHRFLQRKTPRAGPEAGCRPRGCPGAWKNLILGIFYIKPLTLIGNWTKWAEHIRETPAVVLAWPGYKELPLFPESFSVGFSFLLYAGGVPRLISEICRRNGLAATPQMTENNRYIRVLTFKNTS